MTIESPGALSRDEDWERLAGYLSGELAEGEAAEVRRWLAGHPAERQALEALDAVIARAAPGPERVVDVEAAMARVAERLARPAPSFGSRGRSAGRALSWAPRLAAPWARAAALLVVVAGAAATWQLVRGDSSTRGSAVFTAAGGAPDTLRLSDGTAVVLAPRSALTVRGEYGARARTVDLVGLAYFDVVHDAGRPFTVHSGSTVIRDLGTAFTVRADSAQPVEIAVHKGTVAVSGPGVSLDGIVLRAGDRASVGARQEVVRGGVDAGEPAWASGRLAFRDVPLHDVVREIGRWHGVRFEYEPEMGRRHLNGDFTGQTLGQVVEAMSMSLGLRASRNGDVVRLDGTEKREQ